MGLQVFIYLAREPFDPSKIHNFLIKNSGVIRSKAFFVQVDRLLVKFQAGAFVRHRWRWWTTVLDRWPED